MATFLDLMALLITVWCVLKHSLSRTRSSQLVMSGEPLVPPGMVAQRRNDILFELRQPGYFHHKRIMVDKSVQVEPDNNHPDEVDCICPTITTLAVLEHPPKLEGLRQGVGDRKVRFANHCANNIIHNKDGVGDINEIRVEPIEVFSVILPEENSIDQQVLDTSIGNKEQSGEKRCSSNPANKRRDEEVTDAVTVEPQVGSLNVTLPEEKFEAEECKLDDPKEAKADSPCVVDCLYYSMKCCECTIL